MGLKTTHRIRTPLWQLCGFALLSAKVGVCLRRLQSNGAGYLQCTIQIVHVYSSYIFILCKSVQVSLQKGCLLQTRSAQGCRTDWHLCFLAGRCLHTGLTIVPSSRAKCDRCSCPELHVVLSITCRGSAKVQVPEKPQKRRQTMPIIFMLDLRTQAILST